MYYFFLASFSFFSPYAPPAAKSIDKPPSMGVAGGAPCAKSAIGNSVVAADNSMIIFFIALII
jgi:hypothetical protein